MSSPPKREMAISGAHQIFMLQLNKQKVILFSDESHKFQKCKDNSFNPIYNIADYLYLLSSGLEGNLYIESSGKNQWNKQEPSHMEDIYVKFFKKRGTKQHKVNNFLVHEIDERFTTTNISDLVFNLIGKNITKSLKKLLRMIENKDFDAYKKSVDFAVDILKSKYKIIDDFLEKALDVNFKDLLEIYEENKDEMLAEFEQIKIGELKQINNDHVLYEFLSSFFMFLVDFTFFIHFLNSPSKLHFVFLGGKHIKNIIKIFEFLGLKHSQVKILNSKGNCIQVKDLNDFLNVRII